MSTIGTLDIARPYARSDARGVSVGSPWRWPASLYRTSRHAPDGAWRNSVIDVLTRLEFEAARRCGAQEVPERRVDDPAVARHDHGPTSEGPQRP